jgi:acetyl-CoA carboxylase carboxyl transferase subunit alpha
LPIISFIDTPGAYPGIGAEERGQSQAIADNLFEMSTLDVPIISIVIGEGASGGALAIGLADRIICLEYSWYSVISPEGCASILFGDPSFNKEAAELLKVNSRDLFDMNIADKIINEPLGGAHNDEFMVYNSVKDVISNEYKYLKSLSRTKLVDERIKKYNNIGVFKDE